jgi:hypothetical protein
MGVISESADVVKKIALMTFIVSSMLIIGRLINVLIPWQYLGYFFTFVRQEVLLFDFMINTPVLLTLVGISFFIEATIWSIRGLMALISLVGWNK